MPDGEKFVCPVCSAKISAKNNFTRHVNGHSKNKLKRCPHCEFQGRADSVKRHLHRIHAQEAQTRATNRPNHLGERRTIDQTATEQVDSRVGQDKNSGKDVQTSTIATQTENAAAAEGTSVNVDDDNNPPSTDDTTQTEVTEQPTETEEQPASDEPHSTVELVEEEEAAEEGGNEQNDEQWKPEDYYSIRKVKDFYSRKWKTKNSNFEIKIKDLPAENWQRRLLQVLEHILRQVRSLAPPNAMGRIVVYIGGIAHSINERVRTIDELDLQQLLERIESVLNSSQSADISQGLKINMICTAMPQGGGRNRIPGSYDKRSILDGDEWAKRKRSLLDPAKKAKDNLCMSRCLVVAQALVNHETLRDVDGGTVPFDTLYRGKGSVQTLRAEKLHREANVPIGPQCGIRELIKFQEHLTGYQLILYEEGYLKPIYKGPTYKPMQLYLYLSRHHYRVINPRKLAGFFVKDKFCKHCLEAFNGKHHKCGSVKCYHCPNPECSNTALETKPRICDSCDRTFNSSGCFVAHEGKECQRFSLCKNCNKVVKRSMLDPEGYILRVDEPQPESNHHCLQGKCRYCQQWFNPGFHPYCWVQIPKDARNISQNEEIDENAEEGLDVLLGERDFELGYEDGDASDSNDGACRELKEKAEKPKSRLIFGDFETETQDGFLKPIHLCLEDEDGTPYPPYIGPDCAKRFVQDCFRKRKAQQDDNGGPPRKKAKTDDDDVGFKNCTFIFHNFCAFDSYPILHEIHQNKIKPSTLFRGSKLLSMRLPQRNIRYVDSLLHIGLPLGAIPSAYGLTGEAKGFFPFKMLTPECRQYRGSFPSLDKFDPDNMTSKLRRQLVQWHKTEKRRYDEDPTLIYDIQEQNQYYCQNDVTLLRKGVAEYRKRMMTLFSGIDPMDGFVTLPSYCNYCYRALMMPKDSIAIIPPRGYGTVKCSAESVAWLEWMSYQLGLPIMHARNSNEITVGKYKVDGMTFTSSGSPVILEYHGCYYHGDPKCIKDRTKMCNGRTMDQCHQDTLEKEKFLKDRGYQLISVYACEVAKQMASDREMCRFITQLRCKLRKTEPLNPRLSLRGGRTNCLRKYYKPKMGESLEYVDINSLYPSVNFSSQSEQWPLGHPSKIYLWDFPPMKEVFGLVQATFRPPDRLTHPVLGVISNHKFVYGLCATCIEEGATTYCTTHTDKQRQISGTFVSEEVKLALNKGYEVVSVDEIWHWDEDRRSTTLFKPFISRAYQDKVESTGWPEDIQQLISKHGKDHEEVREAIRTYKEKVKNELGFDIRDEFVEYNPARRQASKLILNNFWGYWGKKPGKEVTTYVESLDEFYRLLFTKDVASYNPVNDDMLVVRWREKEYLEQPDGKSNVVLAAFTSSYARLRLYHFLDIVQERACYLDTDSLIYINVPGKPAVPCGDMLGQMKNEILDEYGPEATIGCYGAAGCKSYCILVINKHTGAVVDWKRKLKGIRASYKVDNMLPAEKLMDMIKNEYSMLVPQRNLHRNKEQTTLQWQNMEKIVRSTFSKRLQPDNIEDFTDPIGSRPPPPLVG